MSTTKNASINHSPIVRIMDLKTGLCSNGILLWEWMNGDADIEWSNGDTLPYNDYQFFIDDYSEMLMRVKQDRNNTPIFEGDICEFTLRIPTGFKEYTGTVFWHEESCMFCLASNIGRVGIHEAQRLKVIGHNVSEITAFLRKKSKKA